MASKLNLSIDDVSNLPENPASAVYSHVRNLHKNQNEDGRGSKTAIAKAVEFL